MTTTPDSISDDVVSDADWRRYGQAHAVSRHLYYTYRHESNGGDRGRVHPRRVQKAYDEWVAALDVENAIRFEISEALGIRPMDVYVRFLGLPEEIREEV